MSDSDKTPEALNIATTEMDYMGSGSGVVGHTFIDALTAGTFIATTLMLVLAIVTVVKEIQVRKLNGRLDDLENKIVEKTARLEKEFESKVRKITTAVAIEEICAAFVKDVEIERISDYQKVKVNLNRLVFNVDADQMQRATLTLNNYISPHYAQFSEKMKYFYIQMWVSGEIHNVGLEEWFVTEYESTFHEDVAMLGSKNTREDNASKQK